LVELIDQSILLFIVELTENVDCIQFLLSILKACIGNSLDRVFEAISIDRPALNCAKSTYCFSSEIVVHQGKGTKALPCAQSMLPTITDLHKTLPTPDHKKVHSWLALGINDIPILILKQTHLPKNSVDFSFVQLTYDMIVLQRFLV
jgi:hypothetical protein